MKIIDQARETIDFLTGVLEQEERNLDEALGELERQLARIRSAKTENGESIERAARPMPRDDICPICWVMLGIESGLTKPDTDVANQMPGLQVVQCSHFASGLRCRWHAASEN